ncbi:MAG TPA: sulfite exporter TauE/SafE family protein [Bdellovibrio sp.]|uniref:sulfite exporter TauE/SafE family protein n=1 Tax=Bdellovibrio sp. TaxID=28201 RepID=UPI002F16185C
MNQSVILALGILTSSFLGSWHCAGMCGPIASLMAQKKSLVSYHIARLLSYTTLGALCGLLGQSLLSSSFIWLRTVSSIVFALFLLLMGLSFLFPQHVPQMAVSQKIFRSMRTKLPLNLQSSGIVVGLLSGLLPCSWLYTYLIAAMASQSPWAGAFIMALFALGGIPALSLFPGMIKKVIAAGSARQKKIAGGILIAASLYSLCSFLFLH